MSEEMTGPYHLKGWAWDAARRRLSLALPVALADLAALGAWVEEHIGDDAVAWGVGTLRICRAEDAAAWQAELEGGGR